MKTGVFSVRRRPAWLRGVGMCGTLLAMATLAHAQQSPASAAGQNAQQGQIRTTVGQASALVSQADALFARYLTAPDKAARDALWVQLNALVKEGEDDRFAGQAGRFGPL
ncbi:MAG: hypothetical protein AAFQ28_08500, partial [Pseudomonadota bacterium]